MTCTFIGLARFRSKAEENPIIRQAIHVLPLIAVLTVIPPSPSGDAIIRAQVGTSEVVIRTTSRVAGAIHSVTWKGKEFIDSTDHGRQLQSALNLDCDKSFAPEAFNPTEAGSRFDHTGDKSTSRLLRMTVDGSELRTTTQMAFWLKPGEKSGSIDACNDRSLSDYILYKRVKIGRGNLDNVIEYDVSFLMPEGKIHTYAQFEAVTGYMPADFNRFMKFDRVARTIRPLSDGPGEQECPVILSTANGSHAMGIYSPESNPSYGRFRFRTERVNKWNCVFRVKKTQGVKSGVYRYRSFVIIGRLEDVAKSMVELSVEFSGKN